MRGCCERCGGREGGKEGGTEGRRSPAPTAAGPGPRPGGGAGPSWAPGGPSRSPREAVAQAGGEGCMAARRLLLSTMKQICLCAAASFAVRPCPPSPLPFGPVLWGKTRFPPPTHTHNPTAGPQPSPAPAPRPRCALSEPLCPCTTKGRAPRSQFAQ
ncbi:ankyrin repeat domain-containing protein 24 [Aix galericulata]|nr:ankyrin repeat domain-containing protein 24 [Aix galericulata]